MKKALFLAYYYPPLGGIGSLRSQKFARYLPEFGWQTTVISPERGSSWIDQTLEDGTARGVEVVRTPTINFGSLFKGTAGNGSSNGASNHHVRDAASRSAAMVALRHAVHKWVYIPDGQIGWFPYALRASKQVIETRSIDAIWSTSFPLTAHLVAYRLKLATGKPWIADFRDLWTDCAKAGYSDSLRKSLDKIIQSKLLAKADAIVTVSHTLADELRSVTGGRKRVEVIRNGFDSEDFAGIECIKPSKWTTTFVGTYYNFYDPSPFLAALQRLIEQGRIARTDARVVFVGEANPDLTELVERYGVGDITSFTGFISNREAISYQVNSSLLLFTLHGQNASSGHMTGKLFEYLGARRPILGIVSSDFEAARIIRETRSGVTYEPSDERGIEKFLVQSYSAYKEGNDPISEKVSLSAYERKASARQLADLLNDVTAAKGKQT